MSREEIAIHKVNYIIDFRKRTPVAKRIVPSIYSKNYVERSLGLKLALLKKAKNTGKSDATFYPCLQTVARLEGDPNLFEYVNRKQKAIDNATKAFEWIKENNKFPTEYKNPEMFRILRNFKYIKQGLLMGVWYAELDEIASSYGYPGYFGNFSSEIVSSDISDLMKFYKKHNRKPMQLSDSKEERDLYRKLIRLKQVKQGKTIQQWNPEIDRILKTAKMKNFFN